MRKLMLPGPAELSATLLIELSGTDREVKAGLDHPAYTDRQELRNAVRSSLAQDLLPEAR